MKIGIILPYLSGHGGTETVLSYWINYFEEKSVREIEIEYVLPQGTESANWIGDGKFVINEAPSNSGIKRRLSGVLFLANYVQSFEGAFLICLSTKLIKLVDLFRKIFRKNFKVISWIHFSISHGVGINTDDLLKADFHFAISEGIRNQLLELGVEEQSIFTIGNPINHNNHTIKRGTEDCIRFVYIGRIQIDEQKNLRELITALKDISGNWKLDIYGDGDDKANLKEMINAEGINGRVDFKGWVKAPLDALEYADYLVLTSKYEGFGMVLTEALAAGLPCISSACPHGPKDIIQEGYNGYLYDVGATESLKAIISSIISKSSGIQTNALDLKKSIDRFYTDIYFKNIEDSLLSISKKTKDE